jgi:hypothetical protein
LKLANAEPLLKRRGTFGSMVGGRQAIWRKTPSESLLCAAGNDPAAHGTIRSPLQAKDTTQDLNAHPR